MKLAADFPLVFLSSPFRLLLEALDYTASLIDKQSSRISPKMDNVAIERIAEADRGLPEDFASSGRNENTRRGLKERPSLTAFRDIAAVKVDPAVRPGQEVVPAVNTTEESRVDIHIPKIDSTGRSVRLEQNTIKTLMPAEQTVQLCS